MAYYIKANPKVAHFLDVQDIRRLLLDGNYLLWQADLQFFGPLYDIPRICSEIGALALTPWEAREEQDGVVVRPLPIATDERFVYDPLSEGFTELKNIEEDECSTSEPND